MRIGSQVWSRGALAALPIALVACESAAPVASCSSTHEPSWLEVSHVDRVDLVFVIDGSRSMAEEQAALLAELPWMISTLLTGDVNGDGDDDDAEDFDAFRDLHVGVLTMDMGTGGHALATCAEPDFGHDGVLRTEGAAAEACQTSYPSFLAYRPGRGTDPGRFASQVACLVGGVGTEGCGVEQPLEAILKALTPSSAQPWTSPDFVPVGDPRAPPALAEPFFRASEPHGDGANDGFLRADSLLVVVPITDENDCSLGDPDLLDPESATYAGTDVELRCALHPGALRPVARYVEGLVQLRARPQLLVLAPIVGVPVDLATPAGAPPDWTALASDCATTGDPRLCEEVDPTTGRLVPSCNLPGSGLAFPPTRILEVARELDLRGARVTVQSICQESYGGALETIVRTLRPRVHAECLATRLRVQPDGSVPCEVLVRVPLGVECDLEGYAPVLDESGAPVHEDGRALCTLRQLVPESRERSAPEPEGVGWYYDDFTERGDRACGAPSWEIPHVAFAGGLPPSGSQLSMTCRAPPGVGAACEPAGDPDPCATSGDDPVLACDPVRRECGVPCARDGECRDAGLIGWVCDTRPLGEVDPARFAGDERPRGFCVDPVCA